MKNSPAFTLIEILVVTSIMGILFTLGIAGYNEFNRQQILDQATKQVKSDLRLAQQKALVGEKDCSSSKCGGNDGVCGTNDLGEKSLEGWFISFSLTSYTIYGSCGGVSFGNKPVNLPNVVSFSPIPGLVQFGPLAQGVVQGAQTIKLTAFSKPPKTITITASGEIN